ncbi:hypothetical protein ACF0H5_021984 [Mactra antiquata]
MGCRDASQCGSGSGIVGKRDSSNLLDNKRNDDLTRDMTGELTMCSECCNSTLCQTKLCGDTSFRSPRGPICYSCDNVTPLNKCTQIRLCGLDEVCFAGLRVSSANHLLKTYGCFTKLGCEKVGSLYGSEYCWQCCGDDLCNTMCNNVTTSALSTSAPVFIYLLRVIGVLYLCAVKDVLSLHCMVCSDVPSATDCTIVHECAPHEVCYAQQAVSTSGHIFRKLGCRDSRHCVGGIFGRRDSNTILDTTVNITGDSMHDVINNAPQDLVVCDGCCDTAWCQSGLCNDVAIQPKTNRGPICFNCDNLALNDNCTNIIQCGRDEACVTSFSISLSSMLKKSGCIYKNVCDASPSLIGRPNTCWNCCSDDLCNNMCGSATTNAPTHAPTHAPSTPAACVDSTPAATCKLASSIVCASIDKANNANCAHYCGYC